MRAGLPAIKQFDGKSFVTTAPAPMITLSPIVILPIIQACAPIFTLLPIIGQSLSLGYLLPIVVQCLKTQLSPIITPLLIISD